MLQKAYKSGNSISFLKTLLSTVPGEDYLQIERCFRIGPDSNWSMTPKNNDDHKIIFIKRGKGHYVTSDGREEVEPGKIIFIGAGCSHCGYRAGQIDRPEFISLRFKTASGRFMHYPEHFSITNLDSGRVSKLFNDFASAAEKELSGVSEFHLATTLLYQILHLMYISMQRHSCGKILSLLVKAKNSIEADPLGKFDIKELAAKTGLNPRYFAKKFKEAFGVSPSTCAVRVKMQYGARLMTEEGLTVKETAWRLGYADQFIFSRQFSKVYGYPPSQAKYE